MRRSTLILGRSVVGTGFGRWKYLFFLILLVSDFLCPYGHTAFSSDDKGTSSAQFLKLGAGARAAGMGEAYSAICDDATAVYWNPGALGGIRGISGNFTHAALFGEINYGYLGYVQGIGRKKALGLGVQYLSAGSIAETDTGGFETGSHMTPRQLALTLAFGREFGHFGLGVSAKYVKARLTETGSALAADAGLSGSAMGGKMRMALVVRNVGSGLKYDKKTDPLPLNISLGGSYLLSKDLTIVLDVDFPRDNRVYAKIGAEYVVRYGDIFSYAGRIGYNSRTLGDIQGVSGISLGLGAASHNRALDYAFIPFGSLGSAHKISISIKFSNLGR